MKIILPNAELIWITPEAEKVIELAGRVAYKSEDKITDKSAKTFIATLIANKHEAVLEHASACIKFTCDRGISHELVRHRLMSFTQESTRYNNYSKEKFNKEITVIEPLFFTTPDIKRHLWQEAMLETEKIYLTLIENGVSPQEARTVLPNSLKTEIVCTANFREWRHVFDLRLASTAHPQIREIMKKALNILADLVPNVFSDLKIKYLT